MDFVYRHRLNGNMLPEVESIKALINILEATNFQKLDGISELISIKIPGVKHILLPQKNRMLLVYMI